MSTLYQKSLEKLELIHILEELSLCACSAAGKNACLQLQPKSDISEVESDLEQTTGAFVLSMHKGYPSFAGLIDVSDSLERANRGGVLQPKELLCIASVLRCASAAKDYIRDEDEDNVLAQYFRMLVPNKHLEEMISRAILSEEEIADAASPELADIRRHMRIQGGKIKEGLQKVISSPVFSKYLQEPIITIRQGRYVVPVKSECKNDIPGLVHDVSATGSTYFIEPMSAVNANNALRELELKEKKEIERILSELSAETAAYQEPINQNFHLLVHLDVLFAKSRLADKMNGSLPVMNDQGKVDLRNARHPLIDKKSVVPISVRLGSDFDVMIITGPNTGGKTVTLKTVGLLTLMAECGLYIPASSDSVLSTFDSILADIGDEQSIAQNLSTFSSHMRTIVDLVEQCDNRTLVLFDELGAGTDPAEGAALAISLIEFCRKMGSRVIATTHYAELKLYAMRTERVLNASCEFDVETLRPTYKLLIGVPGKSNAFAISRKLGLPEEILKEASDLVGKNDKDFDDVLTQLEQQRQQMEFARREAEHLRQETENIKKQSEEFSKRLEAEREKAMESARAEAREIIEDARRVAGETADELKAIRKQIAEFGDIQDVNLRQAEVRRKLNDAQSKLQTKRSAQNRPASSRDILVGDTVELLKIGAKASVLAINKDGTLQLQAGVLKLTAKQDEVYLLENENPYKEKSVRPAHSGKQMQVKATAGEVDLRGMDSVEAICVLERYLDEAMRGKLHSVRIIHGKGTGVLRSAVHASLKKNKFIKHFRLGVYGEGEHSVTIAEFV